MGKRKSKKFLKETNAQIVLFVLVMIIMRMVVLNFMSELSGMEFDQLANARIYAGNITATVLLENLVDFFGSFVLETYKGIILVAIINIFVASYILSKKDFTGNFYFNIIIAYLFSTIITVFLLLAGVVLFFCIMQGMVVINSLKIDVSSEILWIAMSILIGVLFIKYLKKSIAFSLIAFLIISVSTSYYMDIGKESIKTDRMQYSLEEFSYCLDIVNE